MALNEQILALAVIARDEATASLTRVNASLKALGVQSAQTSVLMKGVGSAMSAIPALAALTALTSIAAFFGTSAKAAADEEAQIRRLTTSLQQNVPAWDGNIAAIERTILAREDLGFSDDALRNSLGSLVAATHDVSTAFSVQHVAMDLARFKNVSLEEATQSLVNLEAGRARGLATLGINVKNYSTLAERLAAVEKVAGGQAEAFSSTTEGAFARAGVSVHNLQEVIGAPLLNALAAVADAAAKAAKALAEFIGGAGDLIDRAARLGQTAQQSAGRVIILADAIDFVTGAFTKARTASGQFSVETLSTAAAADKAGAAATDAATGLHAATAAVQQGSLYFHQFTTDAGETGAGLDNLGARARAAANGFDVLAGSVREAGAVLRDEWAFLSSAGGGAGGVGAVMPGGSTAGTEGIADALLGPVKKAAAGVASALKGASQAARDAFNAAKQYGDSYLDSIHDKNLRAIKDAHDKATAEISEARRAVDAQLAEKLRLNALPVTAAEQAERDKETEQRRRDLQEGLVNARASGNFEQIRSATEALENFEAGVNIDKLRAAQGLADAAARQDATNATAALVTKQTALDNEYTLQTTAENKRYAAQKTAFDNVERLLATHLGNVTNAHRTAQHEIEALYAEFGIPKPGQAGAKKQPIIVQLVVKGKVLAEVVNEDLFGSSKFYQPGVAGSGL